MSRIARTAYKLVAAVILLALTHGCTPATAFDSPSEGLPHDEYVTIAHLRSLARGSSTLLSGPISIRGRVISSDRYGEFFHELFLADRSGGIALNITSDHLADLYPFGQSLTVHCQGLTLCNHSGQLRLGTGDDDWGAEEIPHEELDHYITKEANEPQPPQALVLGFGEVRPHHIDTYVEFRGVRFAEIRPWCEADAPGHYRNTTHRLVDGRGEEFMVWMPSTCAYASSLVPEGCGTIRGIVEYFAGKYRLRVVNHNFQFESTPSAAKQPR